MPVLPTLCAPSGLEASKSPCESRVQRLPHCCPGGCEEELRRGRAAPLAARVSPPLPRHSCCSASQLLAPGPAWALHSGDLALTAPCHFGFTLSALFVITAVKNNFRWKQNPGYRPRQKTCRKNKYFLFLVFTCITAVKCWVCLVITYFAGKTKWKRTEREGFSAFLINLYLWSSMTDLPTAQSKTNICSLKCLEANSHMPSLYCFCLQNLSIWMSSRNRKALEAWKITILLSIKPW